ncbi:MAG: prepilin-type N-terminal cleavage/methylation domain-containing protein [Deltaproteobacteria bacterium]|nr:prepilin-type N-terminal cleavage/methylation domain-containing protein [Deltaproteobacteria bacterium]
MQLSGNDEKGFTLIELMIVIAIIGVLAAIAIPNFISYRQTGYNAAANSDAKNAYTSAQAYFTDFPNKTLSTTTQLNSYGYVATENVTTTVSGNNSNLQIVSSHASGSRTYTIDSQGAISF